MNRATLDQKLRIIDSMRGQDDGVVARFGEALASRDDWGLFRMNPIRFAAEHGFDTEEAIALFVRGAKAGLLDFAWNLICPLCGSVEYSLRSMNELDRGAFHCTICEVEVPTHLDDQVEVSFTVSPSVRALALDPFADFASYRRYFFSSNVARSAALQAYSAESFRSFVVLSPGEASTLSLDVKAGDLYRFLSVAVHSRARAFVVPAGEAPAGELELDLLDTGFVPVEARVPEGRLTVRVRNGRSVKTAFVVMRSDYDRIRGILRDHPNSTQPMLTGKMLLNNQVFRELFRAQELAPGLRLNIKNLTLLFTDLRGSTDLYDKTGDFFAYQIVQDHFDELGRSVRRNAGAIIKTMGDAIMASFSTPQAGVAAALDMMERIERLNAKLREDGHETGLKVGLHEGSALAVNADERLDYFGQTVNIAARVQNLAKAGEIWLTEPVFSAAGVEDELRARGFSAKSHSVALKGIGQPALVYQCVRA